MVFYSYYNMLGNLLQTYVYESDWSDVVAMKRKWEEDYALTGKE